MTRESGLDYFHARYYNPRLGRFMSPDPANAGAVAGNPQSWNAYSYVLNNPESSTDQTGLSPCTGDITIYVTPSGSSMTQSSSCEAELILNMYKFMIEAEELRANSPWAVPRDVKVYGPPPKQTPQTQSPAAVCTTRILSAVNKQFGTNFTSADVEGEFQYSTDAPPGQGTFNLDISVPPQDQPDGVSPGRYPLSTWTYISGVGPTLHIPAGPGGLDSPQTLPSSRSQFTAHIDSGYPYNPIGGLFHLFHDVLGIGGNSPCP